MMLFEHLYLCNHRKCSDYLILNLDAISIDKKNRQKVMKYDIKR